MTDLDRLSKEVRSLLGESLWRAYEKVTGDFIAELFRRIPPEVPDLHANACLLITIAKLAAILQRSQPAGGWSGFDHSFLASLGIQPQSARDFRLDGLPSLEALQILDRIRTEAIDLMRALGMKEPWTATTWGHVLLAGPCSTVEDIRKLETKAP